MRNLCYVSNEYSTQRAGRLQQTCKFCGSSIAEEVTSPSIDETLADNPIIDNPIDFESLQAQNDEIYSWIYIPDTNINYPVCRSNTNDNFYLDHDIYGNYSFSGSIYSQYCNSIYMHDRVTVLYGHNMADGSMFADLYKFTNTDFSRP